MHLSGGLLHDIPIQHTGDPVIHFSDFFRSLKQQLSCGMLQHKAAFGNFAKTEQLHFHLINSCF